MSQTMPQSSSRLPISLRLQRLYRPASRQLRLPWSAPWSSLLLQLSPALITTGHPRQPLSFLLECSSPDIWLSAFSSSGFSLNITSPEQPITSAAHPWPVHLIPLIASYYFHCDVFYNIDAGMYVNNMY